MIGYPRQVADQMTVAHLCLFFARYVTLILEMGSISIKLSEYGVLVTHAIQQVRESVPAVAEMMSSQDSSGREGMNISFCAMLQVPKCSGRSFLRT